MIAAMIQVVFTLIILGVVWWGVQTLMALIPIAEPFRTIIYVVMVVILVLIVLWVIWTLLTMSGVMSMGGAGGMPHLGR